MTHLDAYARSENTLCLPLDIKASATRDGAPGSFEGYGSIFGNRDRDGDIVEPGAFAESLSAGMPALLWQHDQKSPIGRFDMVREDKRGLFVKGRLSMSGRGKEAYDLLKMGALNGLSIGFVTREASRDQAAGARTIHKADLMEISLVTFPANELARVENVKSQSDHGCQSMPQIGDARSFERMLRASGFSRSRAKAITAKGFRAINNAIENDDVAQIVADLQESATALRCKGRAMTAFEKILGATNSLTQVANLFPDQSKTVSLINVKLGKVTFTVNAPSFADWECVIQYYDFRGARPVRKQERLYLIKGRSRNNVTVDRGTPPVFNPLKIDHWRQQFPEQLVLDKNTATIKYLKFDDPSIDDLSQRAVNFSVSVRS